MMEGRSGSLKVATAIKNESMHDRHLYPRTRTQHTFGLPSRSPNLTDGLGEYDILRPNPSLIAADMRR